MGKMKLSLTYSSSYPRALDEAIDPYEGQIMFDSDTNRMRVYCGGAWIDLGNPSCQETISYKRQIKRQTSCPNCGAPHNPNSSHCEYCGTYF